MAETRRITIRVTIPSITEEQANLVKTAIANVLKEIPGEERPTIEGKQQIRISVPYQVS